MCRDWLNADSIQIFVDVAKKKKEKNQSWSESQALLETEKKVKMDEHSWKD